MDGQTDGQTDGGDCNIPDAFLKKRGDNKSCILCTSIFNVCGVALITGHLQKIDRRKLNKTWVSKALRHVPD